MPLGLCKCWYSTSASFPVNYLSKIQYVGRQAWGFTTPHGFDCLINFFPSKNKTSSESSVVCLRSLEKVWVWVCFDICFLLWLCVCLKSLPSGFVCFCSCTFSTFSLGSLSLGEPITVSTMSANLTILFVCVSTHCSWQRGTQSMAWTARWQTENWKITWEAWCYVLSLFWWVYPFVFVFFLS